MRKRLAAAIICLGGSAFAADSPGMSCHAAILVQYFPGANDAKFPQFVQGHLKFLAEQMRSGMIEAGGPNGSEGGGFLLFPNGDPATVEGVLQKDPLVANHVVNYVLHAWKECRAAK